MTILQKEIQVFKIMQTFVNDVLIEILCLTLSWDLSIVLRDIWKHYFLV